MTSEPKCCDHCERIARHTDYIKNELCTNVCCVAVCERGSEKCGQNEIPHDRKRMSMWSGFVVAHSNKKEKQSEEKKKEKKVMGIADIFNEYASVIWFIVRSSIAKAIVYLLTNMRVAFQMLLHEAIKRKTNSGHFGHSMDGGEKESNRITET